LGRVSRIAIVLFSIILLLSACGAQTNSSAVPLSSDAHNNNAQENGGTGDNVQITQQQVPPSPIIIQGHQATPVQTTSTPSTQSTPTSQVSTTSTPTNIPTTGTGTDPYGEPPALTAEEIQLTQQLFAKINSDRAASGLYPFQWNETLSGGARLHSWNMYHCGFSHTCPDGKPQCDRIGNEGFTGYTDCGENIGYAGPFPTPWEGTYKIQQSMVDEPPSGWHRIHLFSTTLNRVGVGVYVDPNGYIWFTEDMVS
jgi:uncharacterized protein YkwD